MANVLQHRKRSLKADGADTTQIQPFDWNDGHVLIGGNAGDVLVRDPSEAAYGGAWAPRGQTFLNTAATGTVHNWAPPGLTSRPTIVECHGTADLTITGIAAAGVTGQELTIKNWGSGIVLLHNVNGGSTAPNQLYNAIQSGPTALGLHGWARYVWNGAWGLVGHEQGTWITPPFDAATFLGLAPLTWTVTAGQVKQFAYYVHGRTMQWNCYIESSTLGGSPAVAIYIGFPGSYDCPSSSPAVGSIYMVGGQFMITGTHTPGNRSMVIIRDSALTQTFTPGPLWLYLHACTSLV